MTSFFGEKHMVEEYLETIFGSNNIAANFTQNITSDEQNYVSKEYPIQTESIPNSLMTGCLSAVMMLIT